jgi:uncharacterized protein (DUF1684 family)
MVHRNAVICFLLTPLLIGLPGAKARASSDDAYRAEIEQFRQRREANLKADDGWLSVVGLHWLRQGESRLGSDPASDVLLPARAPGNLGTLILRGDQALFRAAPDVTITRGGQTFKEGEIRSDAVGNPDVLAFGGIRLILLKRGARYALRVKDSQSASRASFAGLRWYPINEDWKISAKFVRAPARTKLVFDNIVGEQDVSDSPGYAVFERGGKTYKLQAAREPDGSLWFVFRDGTSGRTTHGGARQLVVPVPKGDVVVLDFNRATNLPCAYIPYATCPLAPPQNRLSLAIPAGELKYEPGAKSPQTAENAIQ